MKTAYHALVLACACYLPLCLASDTPDQGVNDVTRAADEKAAPEDEGAGVDLDTMVVRAARQPLPISRLGGSATILDGDDLGRRQTMGLGEILRSVPGMAVSRLGGVGSQTQLRLRGGEANHVLVFVNGVKVNDPSQSDEYNVAHLLSYDVASVEVVRGPQSALWGSDALSGVIEIVTRRAAEGLRADLFVTGGSADWRHYGASIRYANERLQAAFSGNTLRTDGHNISRQGSEKDGYQNRTLNLTAGYQLASTAVLDASLRYTAAQNEFDGTDPATGLLVDRDDSSEVSDLHGRIALRLEVMDGRSVHLLQYAATAIARDNLTEDENAPGGYDLRATETDTSLIGYQTSLRPWPEHWFTVAIERRMEEIEQRGLVLPFGDPNRVENLKTDSLIAAYRGRLAGGLDLLLSVRSDFNSAFDDKTTGRASLSWLLADSSVKLRAAYGAGIKNPTFTERFGYFTNFVGNPDLRPEQSLGWEIGADLRLQRGALHISLTWFEEELQDEINGFFFDADAGGFTAINEHGVSERRGLELSGNWRLAETLDLRLAYTWLHATEKDVAGNARRDEVRRPNHIASASLNWSILADQANLGLHADYNGNQKDVFFSPVEASNQTVELPDFTLVTLAGSYELNAGLRIFARLENLLDERYEEVAGYRAPGRSVYLGVGYDFAP